MPGWVFVVSGDPSIARDTAYSVLTAQGFTVTPTGPWTASAERGSKAASVVLGAFAGSSGRHVKIDVSCATDPHGNLAITLSQGTSGWSGGVIGKGQADTIYQTIYGALGRTFAAAAVLLTNGPTP